MKKIILSILSLFAINSSVMSQEVIKHRYSYLAMDGDFFMNPEKLNTVNDKRNPSRIILSTSKKANTPTIMTFFDHHDTNKIIAKCSFQFIGSRPDPFYFPEHKTSIWDIFEKTEDHEGDCSAFKFVISRSPHDTTGHMHIRYGDNAEKLLNMSKDKEDNHYNPWWSEYLGTE